MKMNTNYNTGYEHTAEFYDDFKPYHEREDVEFFVEMAVQSGGPVLELGCGTGRILIPIAKEGVEIVGIDTSPGMLAVCGEKLSGESEGVQSGVRLLDMDMRSIEFVESFSLITAPFRSFQHLLTVEDQMRTLNGVREHLRDDGKFILDIFNPDIKYIVKEEMGEEVLNAEFERDDGVKVRRYHKPVENDLLGQVKTVQFIYRITYPDGGEDELVDEFYLRYIYRYEAEHLLVRCGFEIEELYCDYQRTLYGEEYPGELVFVVRRG